MKKWVGLAGERCTYAALSPLLSNAAGRRSGGRPGGSGGSGADPSGGGDRRARPGGGAGARSPGGRRRAGRSTASTGLEGARVSRTNGASLDVGELDGSTRVLRLDVCRLARVPGASATGDTGLVDGSIERVRGVEPVHVDLVVVPQRHDEHHALGEGIAHGLHATLGAEVVVVTEDGLLSCAEAVGDRVAGDAGDVGRRLTKDLAVLDVEAADLHEVAVGGVVGGDELSLETRSLSCTTQAPRSMCLPQQSWAWWCRRSCLGRRSSGCPCGLRHNVSQGEFKWFLPDLQGLKSQPSLSQKPL